MLAFSGPSIAQYFDEDLGRDLREECRSAVAGRYIVTFSQDEAKSAYIKVLSQKIVSLEKGLVTYNNKITEARKKVIPNEFDLILETQINSYREHVKLIVRSLKENRQIMSREQKILGAIKRERKELETRLKKVFQLTFLGPNAQFKVKVDYHHQCGEYEFICPLPKKDRRNLLKVFPSPPSSCAKYAQVEAIPRPED